MLIKPFEGPLRKVERGQKHAADLRVIIEDYAERARLTFDARQSSTLPNHVNYHAAFDPAPPDEIPYILGDSIHNFRAALDLMICDIARLRGKSTDDLKFPFMSNEEALREKVYGAKYRRLGPDVQCALMDLKPYKEGNALLRGLHDLDIMDKHALILPMFAIGQYKLDTPVVKVSGVYPTIEGALLCVARKDQPSENVLPTQVGAIVPIFAAETPFPHQPVLDMLKDISALVADVVQGFADKFGVERSSARA